MSNFSSITNLPSSCFIYQKWFCLSLGIHNLAIAFQFRHFVNQGRFFLPFGIHHLTIGLTLFGRFTYQRCFPLFPCMYYHFTVALALFRCSLMSRCILLDLLRITGQIQINLSRFLRNRISLFTIGKWGKGIIKRATLACYYGHLQRTGRWHSKRALL